MARHDKARLVLELRAKGMSVREIAKTRGISHHTIKEIVDRAAEKGVAWDAVRLLGDDEVVGLLFPEETAKAAEAAVARPDYDEVHEELKKTGVTLKPPWREYADDRAASGEPSVSYATFTRGYSDYVASRNVTSHLGHKPGQAMEVDWSGPTMRVVDPVTGEVSTAHLFVAVLPYSQHAYVEAVPDMRERSWLECHARAYEFFGGVAVRLVCDNLKTGVTRHPRRGEIVLNAAYESLARHYVCAIMPTGVRKPKQKPSVEGGVGKIATAVIARLRGREFASFAEPDAAIRERLDEYDARPFQKREGSRREVFETVERPALAPLPKAPYEVCEWAYGRKVAPDFHVAYKTNRHSVPYALVGKLADVKATDPTVEACDRATGARVATHPRLKGYVRYGCSTDPSHMPPEFAHVEWDDARMRRWAASIGPSCAAVVDRVFDDVQIKEQAHDPVLAVLNLSKRYGADRLEAACPYALGRSDHLRCRFLRGALASGVADRGAAGAGAPAVEEGGYVRGAGYYAGGAR